MEHKYKAWNKVLKKWVYDSYLYSICVGDNDVVIITYEPNTTGGDYRPVECRQLTHEELGDLEIVKYIGSKDKYRAELYDGDLLKTPLFKYIYQVYYKKGTPWIKQLNDPNNFNSSFHAFDEGFRLIKIGNKFQNPELMEIK